MKILRIPVDTFQPTRDIRKKVRDYKVELLGKQYYQRLGYKVYGVYDTKKNRTPFLKFLNRNNIFNESDFEILAKKLDVKGAPDLFVMKDRKDWFMSEVKSFHNKLTANQNQWLKWFDSFLRKRKYLNHKKRYRILYIFPKTWIEEIE